ncbi:MAG: helix-turn-helix transcriptional regulator [Anaerolineales bacterium]|nr:helix-turn-helix transcriptional regulator [Anaerolineales bacterium]
MKLPPDSIGQRIARLRQQHGFTQQTLADRLAISRVAVSHIEADLSVPSERTITLLAGLFKCTPHELVEGTTYPLAKAERLPYVVAWYTELELVWELLQNDLEMLQAMRGDKRIAYYILGKWKPLLMAWDETLLDKKEQAILAQLREQLKRLE